MSDQEKDVKAVMDAIEELVLNSPKIPITNKLMVDEEKLFDLLDNLRQKLPIEMSEAKTIVKNKTKVMADASKQAQDIINQAQNNAQTRMAKVKQQEDMMAKKLVPPEAAREMAKQRKSTDQYSDATLAKLEKSLNNSLEIVKNGKKALKEMATAGSDK